MSTKVRIIICISVVSLVLMFVVISFASKRVKHDPEYRADSFAAYTDNGVYFMENWNKKGRVYRVHSSGKVMAMTTSAMFKMDRTEGLSVEESGVVHVLYSRDYYDDDGGFCVYRLASYDPELNPHYLSPCFIIDSDEAVTGLTADVTNVYITTINSGSDIVTVYAIPLSSRMLLDTDEDESEEQPEKITRNSYPTPEFLLRRLRSPNRFFVDAEYADSELYLLLDGEVPSGIFTPDIRIKNTIDSMKFSIVQNIRIYSNYIIIFTGCFLIWLILVILIYRLLLNRDRIVYIFMVIEVTYLVVLFLAFSFVSGQYYNFGMRQNMRFATKLMKSELDNYTGADFYAYDFYDSQEYYALLAKLQEIADTEDSDGNYYDAFLMNKNNGEILVDARGYCHINATYLYGGNLSPVLEELDDTTYAYSDDIDYEGNMLSAAAYSGSNTKNELALVVIFQNVVTSVNYRKSLRSVIIAYIVTFIIGSVIILLLLYSQHRDLKTFGHAIRELADGGPKEDAPNQVARDMRSLWRCYGEITKRIEQINYDKYMIFEAYYRFAPKGIEDIMSKDSIFDVHIGDTVSVSGTMMVVSVDDHNDYSLKVSRLAAILEDMGRFKNKTDGILVSRDTSLSHLRFLFMSEHNDTVRSVVQFINSSNQYDDIKSTVLMYNDSFVYGIAGSSEQSLCYIDSEFSQEMDEYAEWFKSQGVQFVVTESILDVEEVGERRFIGRALSKDGREIRFFEVLDAYSASVRQAMIVNRAKFEETLELYYARDFYLARNKFLEIIKDCPYDEISKWYIFECERHLNGEAKEAQWKYLRIEK